MKDQGKPQYHLIPSESEEALVRVLEQGAKKHGHEFHLQLSLEEAIETYYNACRRHLEALRRGAILDQETSHSHMVHIAANMLLLDHRWRMHRDNYHPPTAGPPWECQHCRLNFDDPQLFNTHVLSCFVDKITSPQ